MLSHIDFSFWLIFLLAAKCYRTNDLPIILEEKVIWKKESDLDITYFCQGNAPQELLSCIIMLLIHVKVVLVTRATL